MSDVLEAYREKMGEFEKARREVERVRKDAIDELLKQRRDINAQLRQLGYEGEGPDSARRSSIAVIADEIKGNGNAGAVQPTADITLENGHKRRRLKGAQTFDNAHCSICQLNGHDLRAHRGQEHKRAFSTAELRGKGLLAE